MNEDMTDLKDFAEYMAETLDELSGQFQLLQAELDRVERTISGLVAEVDSILKQESSDSN